MIGKVCFPRVLTPDQAQRANRRSIEVNPDNAEAARTVARTPVGRRGGARRLALVVGNRWPASGVRLSVQFLDNPTRALRNRILSHMNAWNLTANVEFLETSGTGMVRIARLDAPREVAGYWSNVGTDILGIEDDQPTMNLEGFTMRESESEFRRVVRHEAGHTLGFDHEHMRSDLVKRIDRKKAIAWYDRELGWTREETIEQVLTPLSARSIMGTTESDPLSIMCYQVVAEITKDGKEIPGGGDINEKDFAFAAKVYPKPRGAPKPRDKQSERPEQAPVLPPAATSHGGDFVRPQEADALHLVIMDGFDSETAGSGLGVGGKQRKGDHQATGRGDLPKYARVLASYAGARVTGVIHLRADEGAPPTHFQHVERMHKRIKDYTNRDHGSLPRDHEMLELGRHLFEALFQGDVRRLYDEARARQHHRKLDIVLTSMITRLAENPWEFAYDPGRRSFLATEDVHLIRNVLTAIPANVIPALGGPLRILVVSAQPVGFGRLSIEQEIEVIRRGFEPLISAGLVSVEVLPRATPAGIQETLSTQTFSIVHFVGHGDFDEATQEGSLVFEDGKGGKLQLGERAIREIFCRRGVSLVFLNACQTGSGGRSEFNKGIAQSLVSHGLPALVANQYSVMDASATSFAQHFYWALAQGMGVGQAACEARIAVNCSMKGEQIDWAVPVLYARDPGMALCPPREAATTPQASAVHMARRAAATPGRIRVAVWDIDNMFPALDRTLERMTNAQSVFEFRLVTLSAPIDAWYLDQRAPNGTPYLWAEKVAHRLAQATVALGVDVLGCITGHWMRDNTTSTSTGGGPMLESRLSSCSRPQASSSRPKVPRATARSPTSW